MIVSPLSITLPRKRSAGKRIQLNLNVYRNLHHQSSNKAKQQYKEEMRGQIQEIVKITWPVKIRYRYFMASKGDVANVHAVVDKFFLDALVELGRLPDDNVQFVVGADYMFAGIDRGNPRCEIEILENYQP